MKIKLSPTQIQRPILSAAMKHSLEVLMVPLGDLNTLIDQELEKNPLLEVDEKVKNEVSAKEQEQQELYKQLSELEGIGSTYPSFNNNDSNTAKKTIEDLPIKKVETLEDILRRQLHIGFYNPQEIEIGEFIIGNLNEDGYLTISVEEISEILNIKDITLIEHVRSVIQNSEPLGIASMNLQECLLVQVKSKYNGTGKLLEQMIAHHLNDIASKKYLQISKALKSPINNIKEAVRQIMRLEPNPARNYRPIFVNTYITPDVRVTKEDHEDYKIHLLKDGIPPLRISPLYKKLLQTKITENERTFIITQMTNALQFLRSIEQRYQTLRKITEYILAKQKEFFKKGTAFLVPMNLNDVATAVERNESTISRATRDKFIDTPHGTFPLKFFFSTSINEGTSKTVASRSIQEEIQEIVSEENKTSPLSDQDIQDHFKKKEVHIARRTISKYRNALRILPSYLRKQ